VSFGPVRDWPRGAGAVNLQIPFLYNKEEGAALIDGSAGPDDREHFSALGTEEDIKSYIKPVLQAMETKTVRSSSIDFAAILKWAEEKRRPKSPEGWQDPRYSIQASFFFERAQIENCYP
jgi:hypothetical protein